MDTWRHGGRKGRGWGDGRQGGRVCICVRERWNERFERLEAGMSALRETEAGTGGDDACLAAKVHPK